MIIELFCLILVGSSHQKSISVELDNLTDYLTVNACRAKQKLINSDRNEKFELIETPLGGRLKLECHYCDEGDDYLPKVWYKESRFRNGMIREVKLGMKDVLSANRVYMTPTHQLVITDVLKQDASLYYCKGIHGEDSEFKYNYMVDVVNKTKNVILGELEDIKLFEETYNNASEVFLSSNRYDYAKIRKMGIRLRVALEWLPWGPCDGCKKIRTRRGTCKIKSDFLQVKNSKAMNLTSKILSKDANFSSLSDEEVFLLKSFQMSCFSLELQSVYPSISRDLQKLDVFMVQEPCYGPCKFQFKSDSLPRYKNTLVLEEGDHFTLVCPEADAFSEVIWRKDGVVIEPFSKGENIMLDSFNNLIISYATADESANYTCFVGKVRMQEVLISVRQESVLESSDFSKYLMYLGLIIFLNFLLYISALVMSFKRRHTFEEIDFTQQNDDIKPLLMQNYGV